MADRDKIHEFDRLVNEAREEIAGGKIPKNRMDELTEKLNSKMPESVRTKIQGFNNADNAPDAKMAFTTNAKSSDIIPRTAHSITPELSPAG